MSTKERDVSETGAYRWVGCFKVRSRFFNYCCNRRGGHSGPHRACGYGMVTEWDDTGAITKRRFRNEN